jgi:hypothetical protein
VAMNCLISYDWGPGILHKGRPEVMSLGAVRIIINPVTTFPL